MTGRIKYQIFFLNVHYIGRNNFKQAKVLIHGIMFGMVIYNTRWNKVKIDNTCKWIF